MINFLSFFILGEKSLFVWTIIILNKGLGSFYYGLGGTIALSKDECFMVILIDFSKRLNGSAPLKA